MYFPRIPLTFKGLSVIAFVALTACQGETQTGAGQQRPPSQVAVVTLASKDVPFTSELPGRTVATRMAEVRPQVSGIVQKRLFEEGSLVEAGQQLYQIDDARYEAALNTAKANLIRANASFDTADTQYRRYQALIKDKAVSQLDYDNAKSSYLQTKAEVAVAEAAVKTAEIDLAYTKVLAPISGRIGKSNVTEGALVTAGQQSALATINQLDPIYVDLAQPAREVLNIRQQMMAGTLKREDFGRVQLLMEDGSVYPHAGELQFAEMSVNASTGSVSVRALVPNPDQLLMPGLFVRAVLEEGVREKAVLVPQRGVTRNRKGQATALVVNNSNIVETRELVTSRTIGDQWLVETGLQAGDRVIVEGLQKTAPGATVQPIELPASESKNSEPTEVAVVEG